jgi:hypothetical protein
MKLDPTLSEVVESRGVPLIGSQQMKGFIGSHFMEFSHTGDIQYLRLLPNCMLSLPKTSVHANTFMHVRETH